MRRWTSRDCLNERDRRDPRKPFFGSHRKIMGFLAQRLGKGEYPRRFNRQSIDPGNIDFSFLLRNYFSLRDQHLIGDMRICVELIFGCLQGLLISLISRPNHDRVPATLGHQTSHSLRACIQNRYPFDFRAKTRLVMPIQGQISPKVTACIGG